MVNKVDLSERDASDKKRRKTSNVEAPPAKLSKEDLYLVSGSLTH